MKLLQQAKSNSFFGQSLFIFLIRFLPALASALAAIYYSRQLSLDLNGKYISFWAQLPLLTAVACAGIHAFIPTYTAPVLMALFRRIKKLNFILYSVWVMAAAFMFAAMQSYAGAAGFLTSFIFLLVFSASAIIETFLIVCRSFRFVAIVNGAYAFFFCFLHWYILYTGQSLDKLFVGLLVIAIIRLAVYVNMVFKQAARIVPADESTLSLQASQQLWRHMMFYDISQITFKWIDKLLVSLFLTAALSAIYFNGSNDIPFLPLILSAAGSAALISLADRKDDDKHAIDLNLRSGRLLSAIVFPLFFFLLFFRHDIFDVIYKHKYHESVPIFLAALFVVPLRAYNFTTVMQNRHKGHLINIGAIGDLVIACALMYPLYRLMGLPGLALAFTISTWLQAAYYLYHTARILNTSVLNIVPLRDWTAKLIVFFFVFIVFHYLLSRYLSPVIVLTLGCIITVVAILLALRLELVKQAENEHTTQG
ncbi:MAG: hypothetical protein JSS82_16910 [Bacteroidetes bacterium]|nr:hypothetical protein [Bacteroidota bacterium]